MKSTFGRLTAEWVTFGISAAVVLVVVGLLVAQLFGTEDPAAPVARQHGEVRQSAGWFFVPVDVTNEGDLTAADVQVVVELTVGEEVIDGEQVVDFLGGSETERLIFSFDTDPSEGELTVRVASYAQP
jgi:uncharacterized protein (TIGR02588 family)